MKTVSIIIPVYQVADYVERCLNSVTRQTYTDIECIIVDDATRDDSIEKCEKLIDDYIGPITFKILHHEVNRGLSAARNTGADAATGKYIYFLDSDDEITPDCIEMLMKAATEYSDVEIVIGNIQTYKKDNKDKVWLKSKLPSRLSSKETVYSYYLKRLIPDPAWNKLIKRSFIEDNSVSFKEGIIYEDYLWMFYMVKYLSEVAIVNEITYYYHVRPGSILTSSKPYTIGTSFRIIYDDVLHHLTDGRESKDLRRFVGGFCKRYLEYKRGIPEYKDLHRLYRKQAKTHSSWYTYFILVVGGVIGLFGNPVSMLERLARRRK